MSKINRVQLAKIHIACKELGIDADTRHAMIAEHFEGKESSKQLSYAQADKLLAEFVRMGWKPKAGSARRRQDTKKRFEHLRGRPGMATPQMLRKIEAMWMSDIGRGEDKAKSLRHFLQTRFRVTTLEFLTLQQAGKVIEALKSMQKRQQI